MSQSSLHFLKYFNLSPHCNLLHIVTNSQQLDQLSSSALLSGYLDFLHLLLIFLCSFLWRQKFWIELVFWLCVIFKLKYSNLFMLIIDSYEFKFELYLFLRDITKHFYLFLKLQYFFLKIQILWRFYTHYLYF